MGQTPGGQGEACTSSLPLVESHLLLWQKNLNWPINAHAETQIEASDLRSSPEALGPPFRGNKEEWFLQQIVFPRHLGRCYSFRSEYFWQVLLGSMMATMMISIYLQRGPHAEGTNKNKGTERVESAAERKKLMNKDQTNRLLVSVCSQRKVCSIHVMPTATSSPHFTQ